MTRKKAEGTNLSQYRIFNKKRYRLHHEYPSRYESFHSGIDRDIEQLKKEGYYVRTVPTAFGSAIYKRKK